MRPEAYGVSLSFFLYCETNYSFPDTRSFRLTNFFTALPNNNSEDDRTTADLPVNGVKKGSSLAVCHDDDIAKDGKCNDCLALGESISVYCLLALIIWFVHFKESKYRRTL